MNIYRYIRERKFVVVGESNAHTEMKCLHTVEMPFSGKLAVFYQNMAGNVIRPKNVYKNIFCIHDSLSFATKV